MGENLIVERYSTGDQEERSGELAREVVRTKPDVIVPVGIALASAFKTATPTIPIVVVTAQPRFKTSLTKIASEYPQDLAARTNTRLEVMR